jgi:hypothetical protein
MNQVAVFNPASSVPAHLRGAALSDLSKHLAGGSAGFGKRVSIRGGVFRLYDAGKEIAKIDDRHLDVVVVAAAPKIARQYYAGTYVEGESSAPACWSADGELPDASVKAPQCENCMACPQNVKGSSHDGKSRACRFNQRLAIVLANDIGGNVLQLQLPAQSIFGKGEGENRPLQAFAKFLLANKISPDMVVTRLRFDTDAATPKLFFSATRWLTEQEYALVQSQSKSDDAQAAITMSPSEVDSAPAAPALEGKPLNGAVAPEQHSTPPVSEKAADKAPSKRAKPEVAPATPKKALNQLVKEWLDDENEEA